MAKSPQEFVSVVEINCGNSNAKLTKTFTATFKSQFNKKDPAHMYAIARCTAMAEKWPFLESLYNTLLEENGVSAADVDDTDVLQFDEPFHVQVSKKYLQLYKSAKGRNKEFNLTLKDVAELIKEDTCFYTGTQLTCDTLKFSSRTIDRVDSSKGYVKGNVVACCHMANKLKNVLFEDNTSQYKVNPSFVLDLLFNMKKYEATT